MAKISSPKVPTSIAVGQMLIQAEIDGLAALSAKLDTAFTLAVDTLVACKTYCIVTGVGKSGHIGSKIAATFASTGTPAFFVHPTEASHGDLGMVDQDGVLLAISNSGDTREMRDILAYGQRVGIPIIGITKRADSLLGRMSSILLKLPDMPEACPNGLAPTTSTTATLALGDALAVAVMEARGFSREDFGKVHPGGKLGLLLQHVKDWLATEGEAPPTTTPDMEAGGVISALAVGGMGCIGIVDEGGQLIGSITDGDLRRAFSPEFFQKTARDIMHPNPINITPDVRMQDAIEIMTERRISNIFVVEAGVLKGIIHMKDLLRGGYL